MFGGFCWFGGVYNGDGAFSSVSTRTENGQTSTTEHILRVC